MRSPGASPGPSLRATGVAYDVRRAFPYSGYEQYEFDVVTRTEGDAYARFMVRLDEMDQSMRIIRQVRKQLDTPGPVMIADTKFAPPPKETIALSMEALIHHFKIVSESFRVPPGDVYQAIEGPRGELGYYIVSNGDNRPWRVRTRPPSMYNLQVLKKIAVGELIADMVVMIGSLDPGVRRGRPVSTTPKPTPASGVHRGDCGIPSDFDPYVRGRGTHSTSCT